MKTPLLAILIASLLAGASAATVAVVGLAKDQNASAASHAGHDMNAAGADEHSLNGGMAGDVDHEAHAQTGMARPAFPAAEGKVPTVSDAEKLQEVSHLKVINDKAFTPSNGVRSGSGTLLDPYVISGYYVTGDLYLGDTDACFEVKENFIAGQLTLNWNGQCVWAHHNFIRDLRVNENVRRTGYATGGLLEANKIEFIGQLRHYDGEMRNNVVGPREANSAFDQVFEETPLLIPDLLLANIDGFNQGYIHHNTFNGPVDLDLHGHHHGTGFYSPHSHYHGLDEAHTPEHEEDHTDRWTSVDFSDNKIIDNVAYGLRYEDEAHAGDDRTATSEQVEMLSEVHTHRTFVNIARNVVDGGQIWIDVFNADDRNHEERNDGWLSVVDNIVTMKERESQDTLGLRFGFMTTKPYVPNVGILVQATKELEATISGNTVNFVPLPKQDMGSPTLPFFSSKPQVPVGIQIDAVRDGNLVLSKNAIKGFHYGIQARSFDDKTQWLLEGNTIQGAQTGVYYDESVANKPTER